MSEMRRLLSILFGIICLTTIGQAVVVRVQAPISKGVKVTHRITFATSSDAEIVESENQVEPEASTCPLTRHRTHVRPNSVDEPLYQGDFLDASCAAPPQYILARRLLI